MKFLVLAIDFDGTIATNDVLNADVRIAIGELRRRGIVVILVTGRILEDLRRVIGDLHFLDAIVAENGAAIEFPDTGYSMTLAPPPSEALLAELRAAGIEHAWGRAVIEASAIEGPRILGLLQRLELPLMLMFNRGRVMVLPQAVTKATGLQQALTILRLSPHNALGIGDAENDHELLRLCEVGVAVSWGSEALQRAADHVLEGDGPSAVARYLTELAGHGFLPIPIAARRRLLLGHTDAGDQLALAVRGRNILVAGEPKSGKSWVTGLLCEQLILYGYSVCVLDPEGDYTSLEVLPGVTVMGGRDPLPRPRDLVRALRHSDVSIVIDLSHTEYPQKLEYVRSVLPALAMLRRRTGLPHRIVLDEAHYFLQDAEARGLLDLELSGYTFVTYRASALCPESLKASQVVLATRESDPAEVQTLRSLCPTTARTEAEWINLFRDLVIGEATALPVTEEAQGGIRRIHLAQRLTPHVRHLAKYVDIPIEDSRAFIFWNESGQSDQRARTLGEMAEILDHEPARRFDGHLRRKDFSHWIVGVFGDYQLGAEVGRIEDRYRETFSRDALESIVREIQARYDLTPFSAKSGISRPVA